MPKTNDHYTSPNFNVHELADGVYACIHKIGGKAISNTTIVDNGDFTIVFDCFLSPEVALEIPSLIQHYGLSPLKYVALSHYHNDHIRGSQVFGNEVELISTKKTAELIEHWEPIEIADELTYAQAQFEHYDSLYQAYDGDTTKMAYTQIQMWRPYFQVLAKSSQEIQTVVPKHFVHEKKSLNGSKRQVQLISKGPGHTASDMILYLPDDKIVSTGDLIFNSCHPYLGHGELNGLLKWFNYLDMLDLEHIVPGHGQIGGPSLISTMRQYVLDLQGISNKMLADGKGIKEIPVQEMPDKYKTWLFERFFAYNLRFMLTADESK